MTFAGHRTDIPDIMRGADAVVCASSEPEPFGRVIIESMTMKTAVIATNAGGAPDIIENNVNGLLVPVKESQALAEAMGRFCQEDRLSARLAATAIEDVQNRFNVDKHVDDICQIYQTLTNCS